MTMQQTDENKLIAQRRSKLNELRDPLGYATSASNKSDLPQAQPRHSPRLCE